MRRTGFLIVTFIVLWSFQFLYAEMKIGMNLGAPCDWGSEWPFVNIMKYSREWITFNHYSYSGSQPWSTNLWQQIPMDENGYPLQVPFFIPGADTLQMVRTVWANTGQLPAGEYIFLYDGEGSFRFWLGAQIISQEPGRIVVQVNPLPGGIMALDILYSNPDNHAHNFRFLLPGTENTYQSQPWTPQWMDKLAPFKTFRFMDWGLTNNSPMVTWSQRSHLDDYTYTLKSGVPYEKWIELCNLKQADAWVCIPHRANDAYIEQMAALFKNNLNPNLKIYIEYSNELWNWMFDQSHYGVDSLSQDYIWPERLGPKIADVMQIWTDVFGTQSNRLIRVVGCQHGWYDIGRRILLQIEEDGNLGLIDAISPAGYMSPDHTQLALLGASATAQDVISGAQALTFNPDYWLMQGWQQHAQLAVEKGKKLVFYEGGQHFTPDPWGTFQPYNPALMQSQAAPEMYNLYMLLLNTLANLTPNDEVFMHFSFISLLFDDGTKGRYGNFGCLSSQFYQYPPYTDAPKYRALIDYQNSTLPVTLSAFQTLEVTAEEVNIQWITQSEINMTGYYLLRSENPELNQARNVSGIIIAAQNSSTEHIYLYQDKEVSPDKSYYYWLQSVENNGVSYYNGPLNIHTPPQQETPELNIDTSFISIWPNPVLKNQNLSVNVSIQQNDQVEIDIYNIRGQLVQSFSNLSTGEINLSWDLKDKKGVKCSSGVYFIRLKGNNCQQLRKILIMK